MFEGSLYQAIEQNDFKKVQFLSKFATVNYKDSVGDTALHVAARMGNLGIIQFLANLPNIKLHTVNNSGETPVHIAVQRGNFEIAQYLATLPHFPKEELTFIKDYKANIISQTVILEEIDDASCSALLPDGRIVLGGHKNIKIVNLQNNQVEHTIEEDGRIFELIVLPNGNVVYKLEKIDSDYRYIKFWDIKNTQHPRVLEEYNSEWIYQGPFLQGLPNGYTVIGYQDGHNREHSMFNMGIRNYSIRDINQNIILNRKKEDGGVVNRMILLKDGRLAIGDGDGKITICDMEGKTPSIVLAAYTHRVDDLVQLPDGKIVSFGVDYPDSILKIWDIQTKQCDILEGYRSVLSKGITLLPTGLLLSYVGYDGDTIKIWNASEKQCLATLKDISVLFHSIVLPDGRLLIAHRAPYPRHSKITILDFPTLNLFNIPALEPTLPTSAAIPSSNVKPHVKLDSLENISPKPLKQTQLLPILEAVQTESDTESDIDELEFSRQAPGGSLKNISPIAQTHPSPILKAVQIETVTEDEIDELEVGQQATALLDTISMQNISESSSQTELMDLSEEIALLKNKITSIKTRQLSPKDQLILEKLGERGTWLTLLRFGKKLQSREEELDFLKRHPVLMDTFLSLVAILTNQFLSAKLLQSNLLDVKAKRWISYADIGTNLIDTASNHSQELADLLHIPILSGVAKGLLKSYDKYSDIQKRKAFKPLATYVPTLHDQDYLIERIAFLTIARYHELLLLADGLQSSHLAENVAVTLSEALKLCELKEKINTLIGLDVFTKETEEKGKLGRVFGEYFADKWMEILLSEIVSDEALQEARTSQDSIEWNAIIHEWLQSTSWHTLEIPIGKAMIDLEKTPLSHIIHVNDPRIIWGSKSMTITQALLFSGIKHYFVGQGWKYKSENTEQRQTVGYIYEIDPVTYTESEENEHFPSSATASSLALTKKQTIADAEMHYASLQDPGKAGLLESEGNSIGSQDSASLDSPVTGIKGGEPHTLEANPGYTLQIAQEKTSAPAVPSHSSALAERLAFLEKQVIEMKAEHLASTTQQVALQEKNRQLKMQLQTGVTQDQLTAVILQTEKLKRRLRHLGVPEEVDSGEAEQVLLTNKDFNKPNPALLMHIDKTNTLAAEVAAQKELIDSMQARLDEVASSGRERRREGARFSLFSTTVAESTVSGGSDGDNTILDKLPVFITRLIAEKNTNAALRREEQEKRSFISQRAG